MISSPASSGSSDSTSSRCAWPPSNRVVNRLRKWRSTSSKAASSRARPSRLRLPIEPRRRLIARPSSSRSAWLASAAFLQLGQLALGDEIDRADPLALRRHAARAAPIRSPTGGDRRLVEAELLGQQRRRAFELLAGDAAPSRSRRAVLRSRRGRRRRRGPRGRRPAPRRPRRAAPRSRAAPPRRRARARRRPSAASRGGGRLRRSAPRSGASSVCRRVGEPLGLGFGLGDAAAELGVALARPRRRGPASRPAPCARPRRAACRR